MEVAGWTHNDFKNYLIQFFSRFYREEIGVVEKSRVSEEGIATLAGLNTIHVSLPGLSNTALLCTMQ